MDITLVTSTFNDDVHGTDNDKKTGCGISLIKPENVTRFRRGNTMTDLKEITCEKCKSILAKKIIRSDKKEMSKIIKEEKLRAKRGIEDDSIVPLGNTTAKITGQQGASRSTDLSSRPAQRPSQPAYQSPFRPVDPAPVQQTAPAPEPVPEPAPVEIPKTITGTNVELDSSLAQFAINVPKPEPAPAEPPVQDDFLAQFAIHKPDDDIEEEQPAAPAAHATVPQDDFLAQFAIPAPASSAPEPYGTPAPQAPSVQSPYTDTAAPSDENAEVDLTSVSEWDLVANQIFGFEGVPAPQPEAPTEMDELPVLEDVPSVTQNAAPEPVSAPAAPILDDIPAFIQDAAPEPVSAPAAPIFDDIPAPAQEAAPEPIPAPAAPIFDDLTVPVLNSISTPAVQEEIAPAAPEEPAAAPVFDSIEDAEEEISALLSKFALPKESVAPVNAAPAPAEAPVIPEMPAPEPISVPEEAPVISEMPVPEPVQLTAPEPMPEPEPAPEPVNPYRYTAPEPLNTHQYTSPAPVQAAIPDISIPNTSNESVTNMHSYTSGDITTAPTPAPEQSKAVQPAPAPAPMQAAPMPTAPMQAAPAPMQAAPQQAVPNAPVQPQIVNVPQFTGFDTNGQPIYQYVQMQMTGFDANGQPILAPLQNMAQQAMPQTAPMQAAPAPAPMQAAPMQAAPAPTAPQPTAPDAQPMRRSVVPPRVPKPDDPRYSMPTANISKIAVNEHTKPTSRAFVQAISNSKSYANKSLLETQGLQMNAPMLASIEDVISQIDTGAASRAQASQGGQPGAAPARPAAPKYNEYKATSQPARRTPASATPSRSYQQDDIRFMTKSELKEMKKQEKIDAKFKKNMAKRGL